MKLGPTGKFPFGKLNDDDGGELQVGVCVNGDVVQVNFGVPVAWIGFSAETAAEFATVLVAAANTIKGKRH